MCYIIRNKMISMGLNRKRKICNINIMYQNKVDSVYKMFKHLELQACRLRGYCTTGQFFDCFCIFLKNYNK